MSEVCLECRTIQIILQSMGKEIFTHSFIHLLILSVSQSVSQLVNKSVQEACVAGIDFWIIFIVTGSKNHI